MLDKTPAGQSTNKHFGRKGAIRMDTVPEKTKRKRPSQGKRKHLRRLKQEGRKENLTEAELKKKVRQ